MAQTSASRSSSKKSTTVRAPWPIRTGFAAAERFAPEPAARLLSRLWFRLPAPPETRLRGRAPADAEVFEIDSFGSKVWGYDRGDGPLVYLVHGWGGSAGQLEFIGASLVAQGMRVVAFDAPSHGNSGPSPWGERHTSGVHMIQAMTAVLKDRGEPEAIVAHSLGCLTAVHGMREAGHDMVKTRLALLAPFVGGVEGFADTLGSVVPVGPRILSRVIPLAEQRANVKIGELTIMDPVVEAPTLVVHDKGDRPNPFRHGAALAEAWPNAELVATSGLGHRKILTSPAVNSRVVSFVKGA